MRRPAGRPITGAAEVRRHNLAILLDLLHARGPMRRAELTDLTGLNRSTVAALVGELAGLGAVCEEPPGDDAAPTGAGRPSLVVRPRPERVQVLAADVGVGHVSVALVGLGGAVMARRDARVRDSTPEAVAERLRTSCLELVDGPAADTGPAVVGIGISVSGVVRVQDGNVRFAPNLRWRDAPLAELVSTGLAGGPLAGLPVLVGNDGDLGCLAEHVRGVARAVDDVVFVEGEVGVGGGLVVGGRPLVGAGGYAGELGHMKVRRGGARCRCGSLGCWETEIGAEAIAAALGLPADVGREVLVERLATMRRTDDATDALDDVARFLGMGLANIVNLLNPRLIVLGGLLRDLYPVVVEQVGQAMGQAALAAPAEQARVAVAGLGEDAVLIGAAELVWQSVLADPVGVLS
jgi:predicted NBD/HSP70 family sugar kinase